MHPILLHHDTPFTYPSDNLNSTFLHPDRWLGFRLDVESSIVLICVVFVAVSLRDTVDVGLIGFTIVYTLSLSGLLQWTVRQVTTAKLAGQIVRNKEVR